MKIINTKFYGLKIIKGVIHYDKRGYFRETFKNNLFKIPLREGRTLHHDVLSKDGAGKVLLRSAPSGTGIIAGGPIRAACEVLGIKDIVGKSLGSSNPLNVLRACMKGLKSQNSPKHVAVIRGKNISEITKKKQ